MGGLLNKLASPLLALLIAFVPETPAPDVSSGPSLALVSPELPRYKVAVPDLPPAARTIAVRRGDNLQAAIDGARGGDVIALEAGAEFEGPFRLPKRADTGWVVIRPALTEPDIPPPGRRLTADRVNRLPRLVSRSGSVIVAAPGAHHYRLIGLALAPATGVALRSVIELGGDGRDLSAVPHDIIIERCYLRGDPRRGSRRGIALNSRQTAIVDSLFVDFKEVGADSQAIAGWNGPGPYLIANNHLEAAGENLMFGGADPRIHELVPADIEILNNTFTKPLRWKRGDARYEGVDWSVKNLFELKNARRILIDGNVFEYNWPHAQNGFAILFTPRNQDGGAPWSVVEDVTFRNNVVRHVGSGINILGHDDIHSSQQTRRIAIVDNVFADVGGEWGQGRLFQILDGTHDVIIDHNTAFQTGNALSGGDGRPHTGFVFQNNIVMAGAHGISGSRMAPGSQAVAHYFPGATIRRNIVIGGDAKSFPGDNLFPGRLTDLGDAPARHGAPFTRLAARYAGTATDGRDPGARLSHREAEPPAFVIPEPQESASDGDASTTLAIALFLIAFSMLGYIFFGYPLLARLRAAVRPRTRRTAPIEPTVTIVVAAHNEAQRIERRLQNLLALDYPAGKLDIMVGSDGSTDDTVARAVAMGSDRIAVHACAERRGKPTMLNRLVPQARGEIVVFADARQQFDRGAVRALVANFADDTVGAVSGELVMSAPAETNSGSGAAAYWQYEKLIRSTESRGGSTVGATGAIYAIRKTLFEPLPDDTILDDVLIPVRISRQGYQVVFEAGAKACDAAAASGAEFVRKVRTIGGTFQLFARERWLLDPRENPLWFETISHKALRLTIPIWLMVMLMANLALVEIPLFQWLLAGQVAFYGAALAGRGQHHARRRLILTLPYTMCLLSWATIVGFARFATRTQSVTWEVTSPKVTIQS